MSRYEYLKSLEGYLLKYLSREEVNEILRDYGEYFSEGEQTGKSEAQIIAELGDPQTVARQIILESKPGTAINFDSNSVKVKRAADETVSFFKTSNGKILLVILAIISAPIWLSAVGSLLGVILAVFGTLFGFIGLGGVSVLGGVVTSTFAIALSSASPMSVVALLIVLSLAMITGGIFCICFTIIVTKWLCKLICQLRDYIFRKKDERKEAGENA